jgi:hypothetical protein
MQCDLPGTPVFAKLWCDHGQTGGMLYWNTRRRAPSSFQRFLESGARQRWPLNNRAGFYLDSRTSREVGGLNWFSISIPAWFPLILSALLALLFRRTQREQPHQARFCRNCGHDLTATPNRCPECGTTPIPIPNPV